MFQESSKVIHQNTPVLVLSVTGDSLVAISHHLDQKHIDRPLALDLLWQVCGVLTIYYGLFQTAMLAQRSPALLVRAH